MERLTANVALNPYKHIAIYRLAVADAEGEATLYRAEGIADSSASLFAAAAGAAQGEVCRTVALDGFLQQEKLRPPDFLKLDVEGAELKALEGAAQILAEHHPLLLVEMEEKNLVAAGASKAAIQAFLQGFSYRPAHLRKGHWHRIDDVTATRGRNLFWFNPDLAGHREKAGRILEID